MKRSFERQCPHCSQQSRWPDMPTYPFCSERCQMIDLGVWASEGYRLPGERASEEDLQTHEHEADPEEM